MILKYIGVRRFSSKLFNLDKIAFSSIRKRKASNKHMNTLFNNYIDNEHSYTNIRIQRVGFIGLGNMGLPMTQNLVQRGFQVKAYDLNPQTLEKCSEIVRQSFSYLYSHLLSNRMLNYDLQGVKPAKSVAETSQDVNLIPFMIFNQVDYIITSVPATKDVEELLKSPDGIFKNAQKGTFILDTSTISPIASKDFAAEAKKQNLVFIDTPMSGGITGAHAGTLTFMVGSDKEHFEQAKHVLLGMGKNVFHCGGPGTGEIAKICNNLILGINMIALSEGLSLGEKLGIDPKVLSNIIAVSTGRSWCVDTYNPRPGVLENVPSSRNYNGGF